MLAVVLSVVAIWATRHWGTRRRRAAFQVDVRPLLAPDTLVSESLKVTFDGHVVPDPHLLSIRVRNFGPRDITSEDFDGGRPFKVSIGSGIFGLTETSHPPFTDVSEPSVAAGYVDLEPCLLRKGEAWRVDVIVGGKVKPTFTSPLVDTDFIDGDAYYRRRDNLYSAAINIAAAIVAGVIAILLMSLVDYVFDRINGIP